MMNSFNQRYSKIRSMQQLQLERAKLDMLLGIEEKQLLEDYHRVREVFSLSHVFGVMSNAISSYNPMISGIASGYGILTRIFSGIRNRKNRC